MKWFDDICRAAKPRVKYPPLFSDTEVNNCFSLYQVNSVNSQHQMVPFFLRNGAKLEHKIQKKMLGAEEHILSQIQ